jgi:hypothetical protein
MKFKRLLTTLLLIGSLAFGGYIKPPEAVKDIYHIDSNLTPVYNLSTGILSMGMLSTAYQLTNLTVGDVAKLTTTLADTLYLRLDGSNSMTGNLDLDGNQLIIDTDGDSYLYETADDVIELHLGSADSWIWSTSVFAARGLNGPKLMREGATATNPVFVMNNDIGSGIGFGDPGTVSIIADSVEVARAVENTYDQFIISPDGVQNLPATPSWAFGDGDTGGHEVIDDQFQFVSAGIMGFRVNGRWFRSSN